MYSEEMGNEKTARTANRGDAGLRPGASPIAIGTAPRADIGVS